MGFNKVGQQLPCLSLTTAQVDSHSEKTDASGKLEEKMLKYHICFFSKRT